MTGPFTTAVPETAAASAPVPQPVPEPPTLGAAKATEPKHGDSKQSDSEQNQEKPTDRTRSHNMIPTHIQEYKAHSKDSSPPPDDKKGTRKTDTGDGGAIGSEYNRKVHGKIDLERRSSEARAPYANQDAPYIVDTRPDEGYRSKESRRRERGSAGLSYKFRHEFEGSSDYELEDRDSGPKLRGNRPREFFSDNRTNTTKPTKSASSESSSSRKSSGGRSRSGSSAKSSYEDDGGDDRRKGKKSRERSYDDGSTIAGSRKVTSSKSSTKGDSSRGSSGSKSPRQDAHVDGKRDGRKGNKESLAYNFFKHVYENGSRHQTSGRR